MNLLKAIALTVLAVFAPIKATVITVFILIIADLIVGAWAAKKRGEAITSAGFRRTVTKLFVYEAALLLGFLTETYLLGGVLPVAKLVSGVIGVTELKSVLENLDAIHGKSVLKSVIAKIGSDNDDQKR